MDWVRERAGGVRIVRGYDSGEEDGGKGVVDDGSVGDGEDGVCVWDFVGVWDVGVVLFDGWE